MKKLLLSIIISLPLLASAQVEIPKKADRVTFNTSTSRGKTITDLAALFGKNFVIMKYDTAAGTFYTEPHKPEGYTFTWHITGNVQPTDSGSVVVIKGDCENGAFRNRMVNFAGVQRKSWETLMGILSEKYTGFEYNIYKGL